jgi:hypothetical protein
MTRRTLPILLTAGMLGGCSTLLTAIGGGVSVSGTAKALSTQQAALFSGGAYRTSATVAGDSAMASASIRAYASDGTPVGGPVTAASNGTFTINGLPVGKAVFLVATGSSKSGGTLKISAFLKPSSTTAVRDINTASMIVAEKLRTLASSKLDAIVQTDVDALEGNVANNLSTAQITAIDETTPSSAASTFDALSGSNPQIASSFQAFAGTKTTTALRF